MNIFAGMLKLIIFHLYLVAHNSVAAQEVTPVQWHIYTQKTSANTYEVHIDAYLDNNWVIYSLHTPEGGPVPTQIDFENNRQVDLIGTAQETVMPKRVYEPLFTTDVIKFEKKASFVQRLRNNVKDQVVVTGQISYMACNGTQCLAPTKVPFLTVLY